MNNKAFYKFCNQRSNNEDSSSKETAIATAWEFLFENYPVLPSEDDIADFLDDQIEAQKYMVMREAFEWLREIFEYEDVEDGVIFRHIFAR